MKTNFFRFTSALLFTAVIVTSLAAQETPQQPAAPKIDFGKLMRSDAMKQMQKNQMKGVLLSMWDGKATNLMAFQLLGDAEVRKAWNVSDEEYQKIQDTQKNIGTNLRTSPEFLELMKEMQQLQMKNPGDPLMQNADAETKQKFSEIQQKISTVAMDQMVKGVDSILTDDQKLKMKEFQLSSMSEIPIVSPSMFEALGLSDAQKEQMAGIKKGFDPEFGKLAEEFADGQQKLVGKMFDAIEKEGGFAFTGPPDPKKLQEKMTEIGKRLAEEDPEFKKIQEELVGKGKSFAAEFKIKMLDILTDEQLAKLQNLVDNPPEYVKNLIAKMKEQMGQKGSTAWSPNANSWKPGEAIPAEYKQKRKANPFPKSEN